MKRDKSIFYRVAKKNEDTVSEILVNMMSKKFFRDVVLRAIGISNELIQGIEYNDISTQITIQNQKRPDIAIENKHITIFVENKIYNNTDLQRSQVTDYYEELSNKNTWSKIMVFLVPQKYSHLPEILDAKNKNTSITTVILFWEELINEILDNNLDESNESIKEAIDYLKDALGLKFVKKSYSKGELVYMYDRHTLQNVFSLFKTTRIIMTNVASKIIEEYRECYNLDKIEYEELDRNIGAWIKPKNGGEWPIFIGYNFNDDKEKVLPLNLRLHESLLKDEYKNQTDSQIYKNRFWFVFPIPKEIITDDKSVIEPLYQFVVETIDQYCKKSLD